MPLTVVRNTLVLLTISLYIAASLQDENIEANREPGHAEVFHWNDKHIDRTLRSKRGTKKLGFFRTLFSAIGEQYTDTKDTFNKVGTLINDNFLPENVTTPELTTPSDPNASTAKPPPYKITRSEFNTIIRRNLRGLSRLFNIELKDAVRQSKISKAEYDKILSKEVSKFL